MGKQESCGAEPVVELDQLSAEWVHFWYLIDKVYKQMMARRQE